MASKGSDSPESGPKERILEQVSPQSEYLNTRGVWGARRNGNPVGDNVGASKSQNRNLAYIMT